MKVKLALAVIAALVICLLPGCSEVNGEKHRLKTELADAQAKVVDLQAELADLQVELEMEQTRVTEVQRQLQTCQARIAELETELEIYQAQIPPPPPPKPTPIQREYFTYRGFEDRRTAVHLTMLETTWQDNNLIVTWELTNSCEHRIHLNLLLVKALDQMGIKGESGFKNGEEPVAIYPTLQDIPKPWPGEIVRFNTKWAFGPLSEVITIEFIVRDGTLVGGFTKLTPPFIVERSPR